jgi:cytochrome c oxidase subunit 2
MVSFTNGHPEVVDSIMLYIVGISVVFLVGITFTMIYFVFKYHRKKNIEPENIHGSILLESIWIIIPTLLALSMFYFGWQGYKFGQEIPEDAYYVDVVAKTWDWDFIYENGYNSDTLYVPIDKTIVLQMKSLDVTHSLFIPAFRIKQDVIYGKINQLVFRTEEIGKYDIACAEYCGLNHSQMYTQVVILSENDFQNWLAKVGKDSEAL